MGIFVPEHSRSGTSDPGLVSGHRALVLAPAQREGDSNETYRIKVGSLVTSMHIYTASGAQEVYL